MRIGDFFFRLNLIYFPRTLYQKISELGISPKKVCEVGVCSPTSSNVYEFIQKGYPTLLMVTSTEECNLVKVDNLLSSELR